MTRTENSTESQEQGITGPSAFRLSRVWYSGRFTLYYFVLFCFVSVYDLKKSQENTYCLLAGKVPGAWYLFPAIYARSLPFNGYFQC